MSALHQLTAGLYLAASLLGFLTLALPARLVERGTLTLLGVGLAAHTGAFVALHASDPPPPLTESPAAFSLTAWAAVFFCLVLWRRRRISLLLALVAAASFVAVFYAGLTLRAGEPPAAASSSWPHLHVILASLGLGLLGVAGIAGGLFLIVQRRLKGKRPAAFGSGLPPLEALDRVNGVALALGFPLLTLGVLTGFLWTIAERGGWWAGGLHQTVSVAAWAVYLGLAGARFGAGWHGREAAASALAGFALLLFGVLGVELFG